MVVAINFSCKTITNIYRLQKAKPVKRNRLSIYLPLGGELTGELTNISQVDKIHEKLWSTIKLFNN